MIDSAIHQIVNIPEQAEKKRSCQDTAEAQKTADVRKPLGFKDNEEKDCETMSPKTELERPDEEVEATKPKEDPSALDVQNSRKRKANTLAQKISLHNEGRFAWLVEDEDAHKRCIGWKQEPDEDRKPIPFTMPTRAKRPALPLKATSDSRCQCDGQLIKFLTEEHCDCEVLRIIKKEFPTCLTDKEVDCNTLQTNWTARKARDHTEKKMRSEEVAQEDHIKLWKAVLDLDCKPDPQGPEQSFKQQKECQ